MIRKRGRWPIWWPVKRGKFNSGGIPFPMLSDTGGKVGTVYGVYDDDAGVETRGRFIIDPDGVIQGYEVLTPPVGRNVGETIRQVQAFQLPIQVSRDCSSALSVPGSHMPEMQAT